MIALWRKIKMKTLIRNLIIIFVVGLLMMPQLQAFDFEGDPNWKIFDNGCSRTFTTPIKSKEIIWDEAKDTIGTTVSIHDEMRVVRNGVTLVELKSLVKISKIDLEFHKYSDGSSAIICKGKHDTTGHTLVMMIEPKNRYAYVYDTDACVSESNRFR